MLNEIKQFLEQHLTFTTAEDTETQLKLASIALFIEMIIIDGKDDPTERELVLSMVKKSFSLTEEQAIPLIADAEQQRKQATDYFEFTSLINNQCRLEQKIQLIESLWRIAFIDGVLDPQEEYLVRKIANLLHVPHADFILAKNRVSTPDNASVQ
ncbi:MAG: TerB family tellurite resistance protein [Methylococcaceae bacterium]|nr:TerB family tellurite resistance protein [Methylococcaceae bacterium]